MIRNYFKTAFEWLMPFENDPYYESSMEWGSYGPFTYVELNDKSSLASVNKQLVGYFHRKDPGQTSQAFLFPMSDWCLHDEFANGKQTNGGAIKRCGCIQPLHESCTIGSGVMNTELK